MKTMPKDIRGNLRVARLDPQKEIPDPARAVRRSAKELDRLEAQARSRNGHSAEAVISLAEHAAWFIREHLPNASFPKNEEDESLPTGRAILHLARVWPGNGGTTNGTVPDSEKRTTAAAGKPP